MSLCTHTDTRIDNTHSVLKVCRLVPTAKSSNYKIIIKDHMINCLKQCVVNREMINNVLPQIFVMNQSAYTPIDS